MANETKKVTLKIGGSEFNINLDATFATSLESELSKFSQQDNDIKTLLHAYIQKSYDHYTMEKELEELIKKIT